MPDIAPFTHREIISMQITKARDALNRARDGIPSLCDESSRLDYPIRQLLYARKCCAIALDQLATVAANFEAAISASGARNKDALASSMPDREERILKCDEIALKHFGKMGS